MPGAVQQRALNGLGGCLAAIARGRLCSWVCWCWCGPLRAGSTPGPPKQPPHSQHPTQWFP